MDDDENWLAACLKPVLHDFAVSGAPAPVIRYGPWYFGHASLTAMVFAPDGSSQGLRVHPSIPFADRVAMLADQIQEWAFAARWAAGVSVIWPRCPSHPNSHSLRSDVDAGLDPGPGATRAVWRCPGSGRIVCAIGQLPAQS
jgi:hypothetical protein